MVATSNLQDSQGIGMIREIKRADFMKSGWQVVFILISAKE